MAKYTKKFKYPIFHQVLGKYENDRWLGGKGFRPDEEWPVAYHGTKEVNVLVSWAFPPSI